MLEKFWGLWGEKQITKNGAWRVRDARWTEEEEAGRR